MRIAPDDIAAFLDSVLAELRTPKPPAIRIVRITGLLETAERKLDQRAFLSPKPGKLPGRGAR